jgi:hypothetical protein
MQRAFDVPNMFISNNILYLAAWNRNGTITLMYGVTVKVLMIAWLQCMATQVQRTDTLVRRQAKVLII